MQGHQSQKTTILIFTATEPQASLVAVMSHTDPGENVKPYHNTVMFHVSYMYDRTGWSWLRIGTSGRHL